MSEPGEVKARHVTDGGRLEVLHELHRRSTGQMVLFGVIFVLTTWYNWTADYHHMYPRTGEACKQCLIFGDVHNLSVQLYLGWCSAAVVFLARGVRQVYFAQIVHDKLQRKIVDDYPILLSGIAMMVCLLLAIGSKGVILMPWSAWMQLGISQGIATMLFAQVFRDRSESDDVKSL